jgi:F-type H+-transporting ATPase subunit delta
MAELSTIARPYAEALFRVAAAEHGADAMKTWSELVARMGAVAADPDMDRVIGDPRVSGEQVFGVFVGALGVLGQDVAEHAHNFVRTLIDNDRLAVMPEVATQFAQLVDAEQGSADARITSAFAMDDRSLAALIAALERKFAIKLKPLVEIDPELIGGVRVVVGDRVLDTSVRSRLDAMRAALIA